MNNELPLVPAADALRLAYGRIDELSAATRLANEALGTVMVQRDALAHALRNTTDALIDFYIVKGSNPSTQYYTLQIIKDAQDALRWADSRIFVLKKIGAEEL